MSGWDYYPPGALVPIAVHRAPTAANYKVSWSPDARFYLHPFLLIEVCRAPDDRPSTTHKHCSAALG